MSASVKPTFGFEGLADIHPGPAAPAPPDMPAREIDRAGERIGFQSREAVRRKRRQPSDEPSDQINIRAAIADINAFVEWCEANRYSYREGFARLIQKIDLK
jgi:hypothetical protein